MTIYQGQSLLTLRLNTGVDLTGVTVAKILFSRPDKSKGSWIATVSGQEVVYDVANDDINQFGPWQLQAYVEKDDRKGYGQVIPVRVESSLNPPS